MMGVFAAKNVSRMSVRGRKHVGTPDYPSRIPDMHTIHDPMISAS
jgi:hypothetical protein